MTKQAGHVREMFGSIASRYDIANRVLSCGIDFYWRRRAADIAAVWHPHSVADLATGTGDLALALQRRLPHAEVTGVDFVREMLEQARRKGVRKTVLADAMTLPFGTGSFDCVTIAFGLRNLENWGRALAEMSRVLKTSGHLLVLEFSLPTRPLVRAIYRFYLHHCVPVLGSVLTGKKSAYNYLGDSIEEFPSGAAMCELMTQHGFRCATFQPLTGGIVTVYTATKQ
ncbi:MAG TPA: bifunctional demethylmenaquinone methyltransferase/2-methoxy-6-polyprenyl-1,4-benzoquinol methylase UbiE [Candidatus Udaeobacter sp.]|jgi:demethylmenaquinone methyltransferase/2-methoxy-6-polyprenyl-1,4-benzoquinol methylase|nr:bifunctional demethylmenaquinone methyltransferase/2-methoxy-6-polyprenyl-1,4-benzoquinol methylase UbiE [Candidatus Udaeobacter sp.]